jgi:eukaryotic-like serine/threonine-protein kinase
MLLGGAAEVAETLGVSRQRVSVLRKQSSFPTPVAELASGPVWDLEQVRRWANSGSRRRPGRPSRSSAQILGGRFELRDMIGSGGFADVFRATDRLGAALEEDEIVAVKVLRTVEDAEARRRFARELRMMQEIDHPNVVPVIESGEDAEGRPWYAMPLAQGSLADALPEFSNDDARIVDVMRQIGAGLRYLHEREDPIFHRDLTPMNVLRTSAGDWAISDFGLAREAERRTGSLTTTNANLGTFFYQAPETMTDAKNARVPADIYSLGRILDALIRAEHPLPGSTTPESPFRQVVRKATRFNPDERYATVAEMVEVVQRAVKAPRGRWETTDEALERLRDRIRDGDKGNALLELIRLQAGADEYALRHDLSLVFPYMSRDQIATAWDADPDRFRSAISSFSQAIGKGGYEFSFCDVLADFCADVVSEVDDVEVLEEVIEGLTALGPSHNRWHVRSVLVRLLQEIRTTEAALAALDGVRAAPISAVEWSLENQAFTIRSLHPALRDGVRELLKMEY